MGMGCKRNDVLVRNGLPPMSGWNNSTGGRHGAGRRLAVESLEPRMLLAADALVISEFMASNQTTLADEDGDFPDWLEVYNPGADRVDLDGMYLADAQEQWQLPAVELDPGGYLVVFASGKDRAEVGGELHTNFKLDKDGERLALLATDGTTVLDQYATYPPQLTDVSYGIDQQRTATTLIEAGSSGRLLLPDADDASAIGATWQGLPAEEPFDDSSWQNVTFGVGYDGIAIDPGTAVDNVALFKPTAQSSDGFGSSGIQGTDGDPSNFTHTATGDLTPFWEVDLEGRFLIDHVVLFNRTDCCAERLYNITVDVYDATDAIVYSSPVQNSVAEGQNAIEPGCFLDSGSGGSTGWCHWQSAASQQNRGQRRREQRVAIAWRGRGLRRSRPNLTER